MVPYVTLFLVHFEKRTKVLARNEKQMSVLARFEKLIKKMPSSNRSKAFCIDIGLPVVSAIYFEVLLQVDQRLSCQKVPLVGGFFVPYGRFVPIGLYAQSYFVATTHVELGVHVPLLGGATKP